MKNCANPRMSFTATKPPTNSFSLKPTETYNHECIIIWDFADKLQNNST